MGSIFNTRHAVQPEDSSQLLKNVRAAGVRAMDAEFEGCCLREGAAKETFHCRLVDSYTYPGRATQPKAPHRCFR